MSRFRVLQCVPAVSVLVAASFSGAQDTQQACGPDDLGVRNGTFDCDGVGQEWRYHAPQTAQNNGVIALTRCASRRAGYACGIWLILFGVLGKFAALFTTIPDCVLGGMTRDAIWA